MPWQEVVTVELRQQFVHDALRRVVPVTELCAAYGISRRTVSIPVENGTVLPIENGTDPGG